MAKTVLADGDSVSFRQRGSLTLKYAGHEVVEAVDGQATAMMRGKNSDHG